jgi:hypothetical protein
MANSKPITDNADLKTALSDAARELAAVRAAGEILALREPTPQELKALLSMLESCATALEGLDQVIRRVAEGGDQRQRQRRRRRLISDAAVRGDDRLAYWTTGQPQ